MDIIKTLSKNHFLSPEYPKTYISTTISKKILYDHLLLVYYSIQGVSDNVFNIGKPETTRDAKKNEGPSPFFVFKNLTK